MAENSKIEWCDHTWNPWIGCTRVSAGCTNCYAMLLAGTRMKNHPSRAGLTRESGGRPVWTGDVRFNEQWLDQPLRWRRPRRIFVCAHGDLFHERVPDEWIDRVFAVMALCPQHTFQVLTKRPERMREYFGHPAHRVRICCQAELVRHPAWHPEPSPASDDWPLPNVWLGVSVEDQAAADARVPILLDTPAAKRFVSAEPLLGPVDLTPWLALCHAARDGECNWSGCPQARDGEPHRSGRHCPMDRHPDDPCDEVWSLDWVIVGGESGPGARPMHPDWARSLRDQCAAAGVPFFFKQWGEWRPFSFDGPERRTDWMILSTDGLIDLPDWRVPDEDAGECAVVRCGKKAAGRLLDGRTHEEVPPCGQPDVLAAPET